MQIITPVTESFWNPSIPWYI